MDRLTKAMMKVVIDGQAYLYAALNATQDTTPEQFEALENEWILESKALVEELYHGSE